MSKHTFFIRITICLLGLLVLLAGCQDKADEVEKTSKVVSQKISTEVQKITSQTPKVKEASPVPAPSSVLLAETRKDSAETTMITKPTAGTSDTQTLIPDLALGYDPQGRIDPFIPLVKEEPVKIEKSALVDAKADVREKRAKTPLEKIELDQLKLRAIIIAPSGNKALVEESSGKGYIIRKGTYIGRHDGKIVKILKDKVVVEEWTADYEGKMTAKEKEIKLPKPPGEE
ncbi:MAG: pilus assembly protein PilP [Desulfobacterales bacterium]|nr:pilus assembly protein PilP [Desulfobacterales bacterium]MDX2513185.1 pilus assembly protein PilP [Desulfobacterales bacterium]